MKIVSLNPLKIDMGLTELTEHKIETANARTIKQPLRRILITKIQDVKREIQEMLDKGVIEESNTVYREFFASV